jgi:aspartate carbamoyltransferase catalytic subunit
MITPFHLPDIESLSDEQIHILLNKAQKYCDGSVEPTLQGKIIFNIFLEDSTRTRMSFEVAAKRLGAEVVNFGSGGSSLKKGETFSDTFETLNAYSPDAVVIRASEYNTPRFAMTVFKSPIINAGDSWRAHPTQALLDALTLKQTKGKLEGLTIAICGDIAHSRVARSNYELLHRLGMTVRIIAPELLMPKPTEFEQAKRFTTMEDGLKNVDVVMMLRIQKERMSDGYNGTEHDFFIDYGLTQDRLRLCHEDVVVMHPGPMNRGVEIADDVADDPRRSLIFKQVANGVPMRMAVLDYAIRWVA